MTPVEKLRKRLADIRERAKRAPPGPWHMELTELVCPKGTLGKVDTCESVHDLVTASRTDIPDLLAICEALLEGHERTEALDADPYNHNKDASKCSICLSKEALEKAARVGE